MSSEEQKKQRVALAREAYAESRTPGNKQAYQTAVDDLRGNPRRVADKRLSDQTEEGIADYFVMMFKNELRFVSGMGWFRWQGSHWEQDKTREAYRCLREVTARLHQQSLDMPTKTEEQERAAKDFRGFVARTRTARSHDAVLKVASSDLRFVVRPEQLDQQPTLLPCLNGTVDLTTGELRDANRDDLLTRVVQHEYDPAAKAPKFEKFLREIQPDPRTREFLQRLMGYGFFGAVYEHIFPVLYGGGANGKGVLAGVIQRVVGEYAQTVPRSVVVDMGRSQHKTQIARLHRTRLGFIHETERDARLNVEAVKALTGGDVLSANYMRQDLFDFEPTHTLYLLSNFKPKVDNALKAIWRRLLLVPFDVIIAGEDQDLMLLDRLTKEEPAGVLRWLVEGAGWWWAFSQENGGGSGLLPPQRVIDLTREYQRDEDVIGRFVEERCVLGPHAKTRANVIYKAYKEFCKDEGIDDPAGTNALADALRQISYAKDEFVDKKRDSDGRYYVGIGLPASTDGDTRVPDEECPF